MGWALAVFCAGVLVSGGLHAADADRGRMLAERWCSSCHAAERPHAASDAAPPLPTIAKRHGRSRDWLRGWLTAPHPPMPNLALSRQEIDDIVAYLERLRGSP